MTELRRDIKVIKHEVVGYECDVCKTIITKDDLMDFNEVIHISHFCGFGSVFGDESKITISICQHCFKNILGDYCNFISGDS